MTAISRPRRLVLALTALALAAILFRPQIASALVTRGDELLRAGDAAGAVRCYARAIRLAPGSAAAADRLAFSALMRRAPGDAELARRAADSALRAGAGDAALFADRAFAEQRLALWRASERDFARAARAAHDPRYAHLAARVAQRAHDPVAARAHLREALTIDPSFAPSRSLLRRLGS